MATIHRRTHPPTQLSYLCTSASTSPVLSTTLTAVVFIHGWCCQAVYFTDLIKQLSQTYNPQPALPHNFVAIDLPGHGQSPASTCPDPTPQNIVAKILALISDLGLQQIVLVGHSIGSRAVLETWRQSYHLIPLRSDNTPYKQLWQSPRVVGVVLLDGSHFRFRPPGPVISSPQSSEQERQALHRSFSTMFSSTTPEVFRNSVLAHLDTLDPAYCRAMMKTHVAYDHDVTDGVLIELARLGVPVLNIQSTDAEDGRRPLKKGESNRWMRFLRENLGGEGGGVLEEMVVEGAGHFPHVDQTKLVADTLAAFIGRTFRDNGSGHGD